MIEDGLFQQFPMDMFGLHNWPGMSEGSVAVHKGSVMAAADKFEVTITTAVMLQCLKQQMIVLAVTAIIQAVQQIVAEDRILLMCCGFCDSN